MFQDISQKLGACLSFLGFIWGGGVVTGKEVALVKWVDDSTGISNGAIH